MVLTLKIGDRVIGEIKKIGGIRYPLELYIDIQH